MQRRFGWVLIGAAVAMLACGGSSDGTDAGGDDAAAHDAGAGAAEGGRSTYPDVPTEVVFENDRVTVELVRAEPGQWTGEHDHTGTHIGIVLTDGTIDYRTDGEETSRTFERGEATLLESTTHDHAVAGESAMEFLLVKVTPSDATGSEAQTYPNATADVVAENDHVVVQRVVSEAGGWSGEHAHPGNQLAVVLEGATMAYREGEETTEKVYETGRVYWLDAVDAHDHSVVEGTFDGYIITLK